LKREPAGASALMIRSSWIVSFDFVLLRDLLKQRHHQVFELGV